MTAYKPSFIVKISLLSLAAFLLLMWIIKKHLLPEPAPLPPPSVMVQKPQSVKMTTYVTQTGTMVAYNSVDLVARIEGYLQANSFVDGSFVKKGQELFLIEPEPYHEKLKEAQATVAAQKASYTYAHSEYERQKRMYSQNATSLNNVEKWLARSEEYKAEIAKAEAEEVNAAIRYSYTRVLAPFDGRMGRHLVSPGNLVGDGKATDLATIEQIDPIYVYFNLNELDLIKIRRAAKANAFDPKKMNEVPVYVRMQNEQDFIHEGKLDFVNTSLNASTGTMEFRALLKNSDYTLLPGLFVQVRIPISKPVNQLTLPDTAILYDQVGAYVYTVDNNNKVVVKRVVLGALEQGLRAISQGLLPEDRVVVSGVQNAIPGNVVTLIDEKKRP